jgi:hypothetical protein
MHLQLRQIRSHDQKVFGLFVRRKRIFDCYSRLEPGWSISSASVDKIELDRGFARLLSAHQL